MPKPKMPRWLYAALGFAVSLTLVVGVPVVRAAAEDGDSSPTPAATTTAPTPEPEPTKSTAAPQPRPSQSDEPDPAPAEPTRSSSARPTATATAKPSKGPKAPRESVSPRPSSSPIATGPKKPGAPGVLKACVKGRETFSLDPATAVDTDEYRWWTSEDDDAFGEPVPAGFFVVVAELKAGVPAWSDGSSEPLQWKFAKTGKACGSPAPSATPTTKPTNEPTATPPAVIDAPVVTIVNAACVDGTVKKGSVTVSEGPFSVTIDGQSIVNGATVPLEAGDHQVVAAPNGAGVFGQPEGWVKASDGSISKAVTVVGAVCPTPSATPTNEPTPTSSPTATTSPTTSPTTPVITPKASLVVACERDEKGKVTGWVDAELTIDNRRLDVDSVFPTTTTLGSGEVIESDLEVPAGEVETFYGTFPAGGTLRNVVNWEGTVILDQADATQQCVVKNGPKPKPTKPPTKRPPKTTKPDQPWDHKSDRGISKDTGPGEEPLAAAAAGSPVVAAMFGGLGLLLVAGGGVVLIFFRRRKEV